jgi:glycerol-3-phosphate acyltransferase PlsY
MSHMQAFLAIFVAALVALLAYPLYKGFTGAKGVA